MPAWNRNEPIASKRRALLFIETIDGEPAPATTLFTGTNELLVDKGDGKYVAAGGTLSTTDRPLVVADDVIEAVDTVNDRLTLTAHGLSTGDSFIQFTTTNTLPGGIIAATNYWIIRVDANTISIATSLANALAGVKVDITSAGAGVNTLVDTANTTRLNDGCWMYEASQAEINYRGSYFGIRISKANFRDYALNVDLRDEQQQHAGVAVAGAGGTITLDAAASATNDFYKDAIVILVGGTGVGQVNTVSSYVGATKVATMARNWAISPDASSQFVIVPAPSGANPTSVADAVWAKVLEGAHTAADLMRLAIGILAGAVADYTTGTYAYKSLNGAKTRATITANQTGRTANPVIGDLT